MFGQYFYHSHLRKAVAVFGTLFNNINVQRKDTSGSSVNNVKVPLSYGPKQKFLARLFEEPDLNAPEVALRLPRMSFEITSLQYDTSVKLNKMNTVAKPNAFGQSTIRNPVPYILNFELSVYAKNQDDALQIVEQILPYFNPEYTVTIKEIPSLDISRDIPIVLQSVGYTDDYEGDFSTRRVLIYTLDFTMKVFFYGPINPDQGVIKDVTVNTRDLDGNDILQSVRTMVTPLSAQKDGTYTITETITDFEF
jgi:T4-like virus Myoviridae tail sheath stabiliser